MSPFARHVLRIDDPRYPECLRSTPYPPRVLYVAGDPDALVPGLGVVGARRATPYGIGCAHRFAGWAAAAGVTVVSGAAVGCDLAAHRAALEAEGPTVAVLGCGADVDYPRSAEATLAQIRRTCAVVSELPWGEPPRKAQFVPRNRIIAGLSAALLVVEASLPSGTFSTADFADASSRLVLAVPGSIHSPGSRGPNRLIRAGATPITDVSELDVALRCAGLDPRDTSVDEAEVRDCRDRVLAALLADPMRPDDLGRQLDLSAPALLRRLGDLEARGEVRRYPDGRYGP